MNFFMEQFGGELMHKFPFPWRSYAIKSQTKLVRDIVEVFQSSNGIWSGQLVIVRILKLTINQSFLNFRYFRVQISSLLVHLSLLLYAQWLIHHNRFFRVAGFFIKFLLNCFIGFEFNYETMFYEYLVRVTMVVFCVRSWDIELNASLNFSNLV